jgi:hypothetical protein
VTTLNPGRIRFTVRFLRLMRGDPRQFGRNADVDLVAILDNALPATCVVDVARWLAIRERACACHRSQLEGLRYLLPPPLGIRRWFGGMERYARVIPPPYPAEPTQGDLLLDN